MDHPRKRTTTETVRWRWPCGAACKMERRVTISCPAHGCRCWHGIAPAAGHGHHHHHHHHHVHHSHQQQEQEQPQEEQGTQALAAEESNPDQRTLNPADAEEPNSDQHALNPPAAPVVTATEFWVPDPSLMVQQLREFESLNDEAVALRVQLEEYTEEIEKSKKDNDGRNWFLALPENIRNVLVMARDEISSYIAISTPPAK